MIAFIKKVATQIYIMFRVKFRTINCIHCQKKFYVYKPVLKLGKKKDCPSCERTYTFVRFAGEVRAKTKVKIA